MINPLNPPSINKPQHRQSWGNLHGSSLGLILSQAAQNTPFIVITPDLLSAQSLVDEIQFYNPTDKLQFPDWETLPEKQLENFGYRCVEQVMELLSLRFVLISLICLLWVVVSLVELSCLMIIL